MFKIPQKSQWSSLFKLGSISMGLGLRDKRRPCPHRWVKCQLKSTMHVLAVPDKSAFNRRRVTFKTPERIFLLSQGCAWKREEK